MNQPTQDPGLSTQDSALSTTPTTYPIGGMTYRLEPASFAQHEWLAEGPLKGLDFSAGITDVDLEPIIQRHGTEILGIVLLAEGQTREQKAETGLADAQALAARLKRQMTPSEVRDIAHAFFTVDGFQNLWFFIDFPALTARVTAERIATASAVASRSLPMATALSDTPSGGAAAQATASETSSAAPNGEPSSVPSLASAG
jgi:hypothetical protein